MSKALVLLSGGQDSSTCLYWALREFSVVEGISFDYGQRHRVELDAAKVFADKAGVRLTILPIDTFKALGGNALTDNIEVSSNIGEKNLPNTFVPGRNLIFLCYAAAFAYQNGITDLVAGVNQTDYSGYPDCRNHTIQAVQLAISLGMEEDFSIHTPLMFRTKEQIWQLADELGCLDVVRELSHSCYNGVRGGCGECQACILRISGLKKYLDSLTT